MYLTNTQHDSKVRGSSQLINQSLKGKGFIRDKLVMTEGKRYYLLNPYSSSVLYDICMLWAIIPVLCIYNYVKHICMYDAYVYVCMYAHVTMYMYVRM